MKAWAILQLREGFDLSMPVSEAEHEFRARWPDKTFRFPAIKQGCLDAENPLSAYVFVRPPVEAANFERSTLIAAVLKDPFSRRPLTVSDAELQTMMPLPAFPPPGSTVVITAGDYSGLEGTICEVNCSSCKVLVELWSRKTVVTLAANEFSRT